MSFRLVPKSVTLNDLERRNGRCIALQEGGVHPQSFQDTPEIRLPLGGVQALRAL